ncbi:MAG: pyrimidine/purine nucleoside phosphorylase [Terrisporobacter sp.]|uniref:pyrimidine/purine nucleoside phosphorylase n=1 Tax=Terrisporobacter sp. TaxID=1965305 RepID=UPI002FC9CFED
MEFKNVNVVKKATVYFDGKVTSRTVNFENGERKTLGFMMRGEYEFNTGVEELMEVIGGEMDICLPGETEFRTYKEGESFIVPEKSVFKVVVRTYGDYCCSYK